MKDKDKEAYEQIIMAILEIPELQKSRQVLEGGLITDIIRHALERQYNLGAIEALSEDNYWDD